MVKDWNALESFSSFGVRFCFIGSAVPPLDVVWRVEKKHPESQNAISRFRMLPIRNADITTYRFTGFGIDDLPFFCDAARIRSAKRAW
jgi:hypothetical protein